MVLLKMNIITMMLYQISILSRAIAAHSNIDFSFMTYGLGQYAMSSIDHSNHHSYHKKNYGGFHTNIWDRIMKTYREK